MKQARRWPQIDFLYALGILLVLIGHSHSSDWSVFKGTVLQETIGFLYIFHMPLFFFIAGFLFQNSASFERHGYGKWIGEKALRLLVPYLFWTVLTLVPKFYLEHRGLSGLTPMYMVRTVFVPRENIWGHFWFIPVMFLHYAMFGALRSVTKQWRKSIAALLIAAVTLALYFAPVTTGVFGLADLRNASPFYALGMLFRAAYPEEKVKAAKPGSIAVYGLIAALFIAAGVCLWRAGTSAALTSLTIALLMLTACWFVAEMVPANRVTNWISAHNFTIYIFSWFFQAAMMMICEKLHFSWVITFGCMFCAGLIGAALVASVLDAIPLRKSRLFRLVFGMR